MRGCEKAEEEALKEEVDKEGGKEEEEGERRETPNEGKPVCRFWRMQQRDWAIAVAFLKRNTNLAGWTRVFIKLVRAGLKKKTRKRRSG